jgi:ketosteroid isomerase-like protein
MIIGALVPAAGFAGPKERREDDSGILRVQTQALADAVGRGDAETWQKYLHDDCVYTSEDGEVLGKKALVEQLKPLPSGVSGTLRVVDFQARVHGGLAIATYVLDEHEEYHGQPLHCQYRSTDTWLKTPAGWRLLASQVLALRTDPPRVELPAAKLDEYCGRYMLAPGISYDIRRKGDGLEGQRNSRPATEIHAEAPDVLFVPGRPRYRYVFRRDPSGRITGFAERREAWDLIWKKSA